MKSQFVLQIFVSLAVVSGRPDAQQALSARSLSPFAAATENNVQFIMRVYTLIMRWNRRSKSRGREVPLVHFADQPGDRAEEKSGANMESRRNCEHRNRRQPKQPPNRMEPSAKIRECSRRETRGDDKKKVTSLHPEYAMMWLFSTLLARQEFA